MSNDYYKPVIKIICFLIIIQTGHSLLVYILSSFFNNSLIIKNSINIISFLLVGSFLLFIFKPDKDFILSIYNMSRVKKLIYIIFTILVFVIMLITLFNYGLSYELVIPMILSVIVIPIFEELIFRGYIWSYLIKYFKNEYFVYIITTILFAFWHLGYIDDIIIRANLNNYTINVFNVMFFKVVTGAFFGIVTGFVKLKMKNTYGSILIHSLMNIFGR